MNKKYETPELEITRFEVDRVIMDDPDYNGDVTTLITESIPETTTNVPFD